jgi:hypothetical protein
MIPSRLEAVGFISLMGMACLSPRMVAGDKPGIYVGVATYDEAILGGTM